MQSVPVSKQPTLYGVKKLTVLLTCVAVAASLNFGFKNKTIGKITDQERHVMDSIASVKAFMDVYKVLKSPRCMNCHPSGDIPLQGDDSHLHGMRPRRGIEGKGVYAMECSNCHQPTNVPGRNTPPGNPEWHLPPANMKMVFQGMTPAQLARQLVNPKTNGHKSMQQLIAHADDTLVKAGWNPGEGRTLPPLSYPEFKKAWITWIQAGAYAPAASK